MDPPRFSAVFGYPGAGNIKHIGLAGRHILCFSVAGGSTRPTNLDGVEHEVINQWIRRGVYC